MSPLNTLKDAKENGMKIFAYFRVFSRVDTYGS